MKITINGVDYDLDYGSPQVLELLEGRIPPPTYNLTITGFGGPRCECGSAAVGSPAHSHWCPCA